MHVKVLVEYVDTTYPSMDDVAKVSAFFSLEIHAPRMLVGKVHCSEITLNFETK